MSFGGLLLLAVGLAMDATAVALAREHGLPVRVFDMNSRGALLRIVHGEPVGTLMGPAADGRQT